MVIDSSIKDYLKDLVNNNIAECFEDPNIYCIDVILNDDLTVDFIFKSDLNICSIDIKLD